MYDCGIKLLAEYYNLAIDELKKKTYLELEALELRMKEEKIRDKQKRNASDNEYIRIVKQYFKPFAYLKQWFSEDDIILACSNHVDIDDLVSDLEIEKKNNKQQLSFYQAEYRCTEMRSIPVYINGNELAQRKRTMCDVYWIPNRYQGIKHGKVILELLYKRHPELKKYDFHAYELYEEQNYEVYPKNNIYTPFRALMEGDIETIIARNKEYSASYNYGIFKRETTNERLESKETQEYFSTIQSLARKIS